MIKVIDKPTCKQIELSITKFPAGESHIVLDVDSITGTTDIIWEYQNDEELFHITCIKELLDSVNVSVNLVVPYLPHSRMDRSMTKDTAFTLHTLFTVLNAFNFASITTYDIHSDSCGKYVVNFPQEELISLSDVNITSSDILISPDKGSRKKILQVAKKYNVTDIIYCDKLRDVKTGNIVDTVVPEIEVDDCRLVIVDDIVDGGRTFIEIAKKVRELYPLNELVLYSTHGIYSKGKDILLEYFDGVYCANDMSK